MVRLGKKVGIIDADIYGPSIPHIFEMKKEGFQMAENNKIYPPVAFNIPVISTEFFLEDDQPLMWRGPMLNRMLNHLESFFFHFKNMRDTWSINIGIDNSYFFT